MNGWSAKRLMLLILGEKRPDQAWRHAPPLQAQVRKKVSVLLDVIVSSVDSTQEELALTYVITSTANRSGVASGRLLKRICCFLVVKHGSIMGIFHRVLWCTSLISD